MYSVQQLQALDYLLKRITKNNLNIERRTFYLDNPNTPGILRKIWQAYSSTTKTYWSNPFEKLNYLPLLFETLVNILDKVDIADEDSQFSPFLFNARSLKGDVSLPFIHLGAEKLKLVSLIQIDGQ